MWQLFNTTRKCTYICGTVVGATYFAILSICLLVFVDLGINDNNYAIGVALFGLCTASYVWAAQKIGRHHQNLLAYMLIMLYIFMAAAVVWMWGVESPLSTLAFGLIVVLAGILLRARHAMYTAVLLGIVIFIVHTIAEYRHHHLTQLISSPFSTAAIYCIMFGILALISWLYNREMEHSLMQSRTAELALQEQKDKLKTEIRARTAELRQLQLEEMRRMYRFTEFGQQGITMLHDLANHLSALTLQIEALEQKQHSKAIMRAREITQYLEDIVAHTRDRLHGSNPKQRFNVEQKIVETVDFLRYKASEVDVAVELRQATKDCHVNGDPDNISQVITILVNNAIEAYSELASTHHDRRVVVITTKKVDESLVIRVSDWGKGIPKTVRRHLFQPSKSNKSSGMGLGLYIAKQIVELEFLGSLHLNMHTNHTEFIIALPLAPPETTGATQALTAEPVRVADEPVSQT